MRHEEGSFAGAGGASIFRQAWLPDGEPRAVMVLAHGASEHSGRYAWVGEQLAARGIAVHALDHRGHGRSDGSGAYIDRVRNAVADVGTLIEHARAEHGRGVFLFGHSVGGCIAIAYALEHQEKIEGLALSAPLAALSAAPLPLRVIGRALSIVAPRVGVLDIDSTAVSRDPAIVRDYEADPLNHHGKLPARTVSELADTIGGFEAAMPRLELPLLVMHSPLDRLTPYAGGRMVHDRASSDDKTFVHYDELYHELLNEPERERVLADLADWLLARAGRPRQRI
jgi:acylglycerol lipase